MPWTYHPPLRHMTFVIDKVLRAPAHWPHCAAFRDLDIATAGAVLEEAAKFATDILLPLNGPADLEGCTLDAQGNVRTPKGFGDAYRAFVAGGWPALPCTAEWGGQGLPLLLDAALREMLDACNHGWNMYPDLLHGAYETIKAHASDELKACYLPKIVSGEWLAAMALTEPNAGSDLGVLRTQAVPQADGSVRVSGQKLFISGGEHDLTDNIVHLVLCRLPDAPAGTRGLSLALVPKVLPDGTRNAVHCDGIEKKMGLKGSATCAMRYDAATGWLIGETNRGLQAMFLMMNSARLHVGLQGLGHQEIATQNAVRHAFARVQFGRPIGKQAAMRHTLLRLQALVEGQRVIAYRAALALDLAAAHDDAAIRAREGRIAALLTPIVKAFCTEQGFANASAALQVFGGYGYVHEFGIEQSVRDARIAMIYEGTNEIQAIDLVQRKIVGDGGRALGELLDDCQSEADACRQNDALRKHADALQREVDAARVAAAVLLSRSGDARVLETAADALQGLAHALLAWAWSATARALVMEGEASDAAWAQANLARSRYGIDWLLPQAAVHWSRVMATGVELPAVSSPD